MQAFERQDSQVKLYEKYKSTERAVTERKPMGFQSFKSIVNALSSKAKEHSGLSYFYVEHIDLMKEVDNLLASVAMLLQEDDMPPSVEAAVDAAKKAIAYSSDFDLLLREIKIVVLSSNKRFFYDRECFNAVVCPARVSKCRFQAVVFEVMAVQIYICNMANACIKVRVKSTFPSSFPFPFARIVLSAKFRF